MPAWEAATASVAVKTVAVAVKTVAVAVASAAVPRDRWVPSRRASRPAKHRPARRPTPGAHHVGRAQGGDAATTLPGLVGGGGHGQAVDEVVHPVAAMALHPSEADPFRLGPVGEDQRLPEVPVGDRSLGRVGPAPRQPSLPPPVAETVDDISRVANDLDRARHGAHRLQRGPDLHPLVRSVALRPALVTTLRDGPGPPARTGVPLAGPVGVHDGPLGVAHPASMPERAMLKHPASGGGLAAAGPGNRPQQTRVDRYRSAHGGLAALCGGAGLARLLVVLTAFLLVFVDGADHLRVLIDRDQLARLVC